MSDLSKIEAWIQQQDDELLYDADGEQACQRYRDQLRVVEQHGSQVRFTCNSLSNGVLPIFMYDVNGPLPCSTGPFHVGIFNGS